VKQCSIRETRHRCSCRAFHRITRTSARFAGWIRSSMCTRCLGERQDFSRESLASLGKFAKRPIAWLKRESSRRSIETHRLAIWSPSARASTHLVQKLVHVRNRRLFHNDLAQVLAKDVGLDRQGWMRLGVARSRRKNFITVLDKNRTSIRRWRRPLNQRLIIAWLLIPLRDLRFVARGKMDSGLIAR